MAPLLRCLVGIVLLGAGGFLMFMAGYMIGGEAHSNLREGVPALAIGTLVAISGLALLMFGTIAYWRSRR